MGNEAIYWDGHNIPFDLKVKVQRPWLAASFPHDWREYNYIIVVMHYYYFNCVDCCLFGPKNFPSGFVLNAASFLRNLRECNYKWI